MSGVNKVILVGRLGKDPETKQISENFKVANFSLATSESYRDKTSGERKEVTEWHNVSAKNGLADVIEKYAKKGDMIYLEGKLKTRSYDANDGSKRYVTEVVAEFITLLGGKRNATESQPEAAIGSDDLPY